MLHVVPIACLSDNYAYLLRCDETGATAVVDVSEAGPVLEVVAAEGGRLDAILSTHHHPDHVGGNEEVVARFPGIPVYGHASDRGRIPGQTVFLDDEGMFALGNLQVRALHVPGHTTGALTYVVAGENDTVALFTGDTLFCAGAGRIFEGTPEMMAHSLAVLAALPGDAWVYCGHEYTISNLRFAAYAEPDNHDIAEASARATALRDNGMPTIGTTIADELRTNPFLRLDSVALRQKLRITQDASPAKALAVVRAAKNAFR